MIESNIIRAKLKQTFLNELAAGNIKPNAFVYIEETLEIWHNYKYYGSLIELASMLNAEIERAMAAEANILAKLPINSFGIDLYSGQLYLTYEAETPDEGDIPVSDLYNQVVILDDESGEYLNVTNQTGNNIVTNNSNI